MGKELGPYAEFSTDEKPTSTVMCQDRSCTSLVQQLGAMVTDIVTFTVEEF